jgi:hypothetical protein
MPQIRKDRSETMRLTFLGKESDLGDSPTLYATDRDTYVVQGWKVADDETAGKLALADGEIAVEVYARLLNHLAADGVPGTVTRHEAPIVHVKANGNYVIQGRCLVDEDARVQMAMPEHEDAVELPKAALTALLEEHGATGHR